MAMKKIPYSTTFSSFILQKKCEQYWPEDGTQTYGNLSVSVNTENKYADFVVRTFILHLVSISITKMYQATVAHNPHFTHLRNK